MNRRLGAVILLSALGAGCSGADNAAAAARIEAYYRTPVNEGRAGCLAGAIVRRAGEAGIAVEPLADNLTRSSSGSDPTLDQQQSRVIAEALTECPIPVAATTTTVPLAGGPTDAPAPTTPGPAPPTT